MKRFTLAIVVASLLSGCAMLPALMGVPAAPAAYADKTILDEQAALAIELGYQAASQVIVTAVKAGLVDAPTKERLRDLDNRAYRAVLATRAAYKAGNATDYGAAASEARSAITGILSVTKGQ